MEWIVAFMIRQTNEKTHNAKMEKQATSSMMYFYAAQFYCMLLYEYYNIGAIIIITITMTNINIEVNININVNINFNDCTDIYTFIITRKEITKYMELNTKNQKDYEEKQGKNYQKYVTNNYNT